ncbi:Inner membrane ABC transporter permease protein YtfT [Roseibaca ekhonensis]|uniref:Inner membrane ABC transporter permease protein YtfT n=1 Tax=Roseinatronobacter ekhonensis TaxID=254356 RepID=A0A3B0MSK1_9RHOB|nr:ABC transporter permease [Roseibaca ekhonensis]SUZ31814.1 Inner membrane ABC transporter permease protein YtfT [Roseibaca ekhonensis]
MSATIPPRRRALEQLVGFAPVLIFAGMLVHIGIQAPGFVSLLTLGLVLEQSLPVVLVCIGMSIVVMAGGEDVVAGGIDLSIPATTVLAAGILAQWLAADGGFVMACLLALGAALLVGATNAALVAWIGLTPLLASLAMFGAVVGVNNMVTASRRINVDHPIILWLRDAEIAGIAVGILCVAAFGLAAYHLLHRTRFGLHLQAGGGSVEAAEMVGLSARRHLAIAFLLAALTGFIAGFFVLARGSGSSPGVEDNLMLEMVLATYLGAAFSPRRVVTLWGAVLGALLVGAITIGFKSMGVNVFWLGLIKGALILTVVAFAALAKRGRA